MTNVVKITNNIVMIAYFFYKKNHYTKAPYRFIERNDLELLSNLINLTTSIVSDDGKISHFCLGSEFLEHKIFILYS